MYRAGKEVIPVTMDQAKFEGIMKVNRLLRLFGDRVMGPR
jgi:hypothetical protein